MTRMLMSIENADKASNGLRRARDEVPAELELAGREGISIIHRRAAGYPAKGSSDSYERTGLYGKTQTSGVWRDGKGVVAYHNSNRDYSIWVRGDGKKYPGAWMHVGVWESLITILAESLPKIRSIVDAALQRLMNRVLG
jgi:hypothetical protein